MMKTGRSSEPQTPWLALLGPLREGPSESDGWGRVGSLRWLEAAIAARGGRSGAVRNVLYKDLGSLAEKERLFEVIAELYTRRGLAAPAPPHELAALRARRRLGRDKRGIFERFLRELAAGTRPQQVVVGGPATGKGVLLDELRRAAPGALSVNLARDLSPALYSLAASLELDAVTAKLAQLSPAQPYVLQAALQLELKTLLAQGLNRAGRPLFLRAEANATLGGVALREAQGHALSLPQWLGSFLESLDVPYLAALSGPPERLPHQRLRPPSREDARRYLRARLPQLSAERLETLLNQGGRHYGELSRLALLELSRSGQADRPLADDPRLGPLLRALAALSPETDPDVPIALLERVLEKPLTALSSAERGLLEPVPGEAVRPALRDLLPPPQGDAKLHAKALEHYRANPGPGLSAGPSAEPSAFRQLYHAKGALDLHYLNERLTENPARLALLPGLWGEAEDWPLMERERLALSLVRHRTVQGDYRHPEARSALALLSGSADEDTSAWARVKLAEAHIDAGRYPDAQRLLTNLPPLAGEAEAEALLVRAALERWRGDYEAAARTVAAILDLDVPPLLAERARLWQGLVAKDLGRPDEALASLSQVAHNPFMAGRARYQEGDLLLRLGRPEEGAKRIEAALGALAGAPDEEVARVRARLGTVLYHLGRYPEAAQHFRQALESAPDPFTRARIRSERSVLEAAWGRPWEALKLAAAAEAVFRAEGERREEAAYRLRRTRYRLALAYLGLATGDPQRPPYRGGQTAPDVAARLEALLEEVAPLSAQVDRYASLHAEALSTLSRLLPPETALGHLNKTAIHQPHLALTLNLARAEAALRADTPSAAAAALASVRELPPDPGLQVWRGALEAEMLLALGQEAQACRAFDEALDTAPPFREQLGRVWARALLARDRADLLQRWLPDPGALDWPEALALHLGGREPGGE